MPEETPQATPQPPAAADPEHKKILPGTPDDGINGSQGNPPPEEPMAQISQKELDELRTNAGRWQKHRKGNRGGGSKRKRSWEKEGDGDGDGSGESLELREARKEAEAARKESFSLKLERKVDQILQSDEYKDLSPAVKRIIQKNPAAYIDPRSQTMDDAVADIQDFLDEELDNLVEKKVDPAPGVSTEPTPPTPPASSSRPTTTSLTTTLNLPVTMEIINENGNTTDNSYEILFATILRLGELETEAEYKFISTNTTTVCKSNAGRLKRILNVDNAGSVTIYDNTAASGTIIATIDTGKALGTLDFDIPFSIGLTIVTATGAKVVVVYE